MNHAPKACADCPWRASNRGRKHPQGWYTLANLKRLWAGLRSGKAPGMTCHPTHPRTARDLFLDPTEKTMECTGALIIIARELLFFNTLCNEYPTANTLAIYRKRHPGGMTREGLIYWLLERPVALGIERALKRQQESGNGLTVDDDDDIQRPGATPRAGLPIPGESTSGKLSA